MHNLRPLLVLIPLKFTTNYREKMDRPYDFLKGLKVTPAPLAGIVRVQRPLRTLV